MADCEGDDDDVDMQGEEGAAEVAPAEPSKEVDPWEKPAPEESLLPKDDDGEGWLELFRDGYFQQLREENEWKEPPPYPRAMNFTAPPAEPVPEGKYQQQALEMQRSILEKFRPDPAMADFKGGKNSMMYKGGKGMMAPMWGMGMGMRPAMGMLMMPPAMAMKGGGMGMKGGWGMSGKVGGQY
eukprot:TRINITY_DN107020_c0_g1_i1.p1 TRINITY_DN107020_c0_g1~~TRINITY_DN107020_c0_g1_i1.p1  ORF type:complete len:183 (+),score=52.59 TRINITY_DN107020_c0_g1_i1:84-632(+)